jgi:hypothetical protein
MDTEKALAFLRAHQPMPSDHTITDEETDAFAAILKHFEALPDERCIPLLINSVSTNTALGVYEHIKFVLRAHPRESVVPHLRRGLLSGNDGVRYRCCWWALDVDAWELIDVVRPLTADASEDVREAAQGFVELGGSMQ